MPHLGAGAMIMIPTSLPTRPRARFRIRLFSRRVCEMADTKRTKCVCDNTTTTTTTTTHDPMRNKKEEEKSQIWKEKNSFIGGGRFSDVDYFTLHILAHVNCTLLVSARANSQSFSGSYSARLYTHTRIHIHSPVYDRNSDCLKLYLRHSILYHHVKSSRRFECHTI